MEAGKTILVAVDLSRHSERVLAEAIRIAAVFGGPILLAHVVHELRSLFGVYVAQKPVGSLQDDLDEEAGKQLADLAETQLRPSGVSYRTAVLRGTPWTEILDCAVKNDAGLIVIGSHVTGKPEHRILGSTAERILRRAPCSVMVVSPVGAPATGGERRS